MRGTLEIDVDCFLPCYHHLFDRKGIDLDLKWGGRDSGKSDDEAARVLLYLLSPEYFRGLLVKKTYNSIKDAQWQTIKDVAERWGISEYFDFLQSPLRINCKLNQNYVIARGMDDPAKVKSISNPNYCWIEEGDQIEESDWIVLNTTLRSNHGVYKVITFNPETKGDYREFWIYKNFFAGREEKNFTAKTIIKLPTGKEHEMVYRSTHTTYLDNRYCTVARQANLESLKVTDPYYYQVYTLGEWGQKEVKRPFITALRPEHIGECTYDQALPIYVSMDFNIDPFCFIFAHYNGRDRLAVFDEASIMGGSIESAVEYIQSNYGRSVHKMLFTGDPGGNKREFSQRDNASLYTTLRRGLNLRPNQLIVPSAPTHKNSREEVNYFLHHFPNITISETKCAGLAFDLKTVEVDEKGGIIKSNRKDKAQRADLLDAFRYLINTFCKEWIYKHQRGR